MILANLSRAVKEQNYFAVALEFVIVISGVVLGFQINAWNEARQERLREQLILERLHADFTEILQSAQEGIDNSIVRIEGAKQLVSLIFEPEDVLTVPEIGARLTGTIGTDVPHGRSPTYVELLESGEMGLIRSEPLRQTLVQFDEQARSHDLAYSSLSALIVDNAKILTETLTLIAADRDGRHASTVIARTQEPEFLSSAQLMIVVNTRSQFWFQGNKDRTEEVLALLDEELR